MVVGITKQEPWERDINPRAKSDVEKPVVNCVRILKDVTFVSDVKCDANHSNMFIAHYTKIAVDIDVMDKSGVTGVSNVQTDEGFKH